MEKQKYSQQSWWPVGVLVLVMIGLLILAHQVAPSPGWRIFLESGGVIASYGLITLWLETRSATMLDEHSAAIDSRVIEPLDGETTSPFPPYVQVHFFVHSAPAIIYHMPEGPANRLGSNGHHPTRTIPHLPGETSNN